MKILFVTGGIPSPIAQIHVLQLLKGLSREHQITVVAFDMNEPYRDGKQDEVTHFAEVIRVPFQPKSLPARAIRSFFSLVPVAVQGFRSDAMCDAIAKALHETKYDLIVFEQLAMGQYLPLAGDLATLFFPVDAVSRRKWQRAAVAARPLKKLAFAFDSWMTKLYETRTYKQSDAVLFVSNADAAYVIRNRQMSSSRIAVLPLAVDADYFAPSCNQTDCCPSLVFLGNMSGDNEDAIVWFYRFVWPGLKQSVPKLQLCIAGNQPTRRVLDLANDGGSVVVTGYLRDIRPAICKATVFIAPLRLGTGVNNRMLQAMAMGKAIVGSPLSVEGLGVENGREVLVATDAASFRRQILFLLDSPAERQRLGEEARRYVEKNHSLRIQAEHFVQIARKALVASTAPATVNAGPILG